MTTLNYRYPAIQGELEAELEDEWEDEFEDEWEDEAFAGLLGGLGGLATTFLGGGGRQGEYEFEFESEAEMESETEDELEHEFEDEAEEEAEGFVNPVRRIYRDAEVMAHLAKRAAVTESEAEAEQFVAAVVPMVGNLIPRAASLLARNAPALVRGTTRIVRRLRRDPRTRKLVATVPVILQRTAQSLADQAAAGRPIDTDAVIGTLGTMTGRVLRGPGRARAVRAVNVFDRRWHRRARWARRAARTGYPGRPAYRPVRTRHRFVGAGSPGYVSGPTARRMARRGRLR